MNVIVSDRQSIEAGIVVRSAYVLISIRDPLKPLAKIPAQSGLRDVLYLAFDDAEPCENLVLPKDVTLMSSHHAEQIVSFVERYRDEVAAVVVHCEQGMSRSPAVAIGICHLLGQDSGKLWRNYQPNGHVIRLMLDYLSYRG